MDFEPPSMVPTELFSQPLTAEKRSFYAEYKALDKRVGQIDQEAITRPAASPSHRKGTCDATICE